MSVCNREALEALGRGELPAAEAARVADHARTCPACRDELAWLEAEADLFARRAGSSPPLPEALWRGIEARIAAAPPASRVGGRGRAWLAAGAVAAAMAASVLLGIHTGRHPTGGGGGVASIDAGAALPRKRLRDPERALDQAEAEYRAALDAIYAEYTARRGHLDPASAARLDRTFSTTHTTLAGLREMAGRDVDARVRLLDTYAAYTHSLSEAVDTLGGPRR